MSRMRNGYRPLNEQQSRALLRDAQFHSTIETAGKLREEISREWEHKRDETLSTLRDIKKTIEESYQKRTISKVSGASFALVGSIMAIVGFGLSFVTFGASLGLTIAGSIIAAGGGVTMGGADIGDWIVSKSQMKTAERVIQRDRELSSNVRETFQKLSTDISQLNLKYPALAKEQILGMIMGAFRSGQVVRTLYDGYKIIDSGIDIVKVGLKAGRFAATARIAWTGLNTVAGGLSIAGVVFDAVAVPFDLFVVVKGAYDIHKYRTGGGSNSNKANQLEKMIEDLEENKRQLLQLKSAFESEESEN